VTGQDLELVAVFGTNANLRFPSKDLSEIKFLGEKDQEINLFFHL